MKVLKTVLRMTADAAQGAMITAQRRGACLVAVHPRDIAGPKTAQANAMGERAGYALTFTTERED